MSSISPHPGGGQDTQGHTYHVFRTLDPLQPEKIMTLQARTRDEAIRQFEDFFLINYCRVKPYYKIVKAS